MTDRISEKSVCSGRARTGFRRIKRRAMAVLLLLAMILQLLPGTGLKAEAAETVTNWKELGAFSPASQGQSKNNTYILEVSSGTRNGGGAAENVIYFAVYYTDVNGIKRTAFVIPTVDAMKNTVKTAEAAGNRNTRIDNIKSIFDYTNVAPSDVKALGSVQTDQFIFTAVNEIKSFDKIQIFGKKTSSESTWTCQGMRIHKVDKLYGLEMAGWYSSSYYVDFSGEMVAEAVMSDGSGIFRWNNSGGCITITGMEDRSGRSDIILVNSSDASLFRDMYPRLKTLVGMKHKSQSDNSMVVRIDFADQGGSGFESLAGSYEAGSQSKLSDLAFCESAAIYIRYTDVYGCMRELRLPFMLNALGQVMEKLGNVAIAGFAQQGDSIGIPMILPDFASFNYIGLQIGEKEAREACSLTLASMDNKIRTNRSSRSESDEIDYTCVAIYRDVKLEVGQASGGATLQYRFTPGAENPVQYSTATAVKGINIPANKLKYITLQNYTSGMVLAPTERGERYLITMYTDDVVNAGTADTVFMQLHYISLKGRELVSDAFNVRQCVQQFYGEWAGNVSEFAYQYGMRQGGTVQFVVSLQGVREFTDVSFKIDGSDEWQVGGLTIAMLNSYDSRTAVWKEIASTERDPLDQTKARLLSHLEYKRETDTDRTCFVLGQVPDPEHPVVPGDKDWTPGTLVNDDTEWTIIDGDGGEVTKKEDVDWSKLSHYMTFDDTQQDLGFTKKRAVYTVTVKVAGEKVATGDDYNPIDDDCGSENLFYFQLIFENGASGVMLANQQIVGDAFRTGTEVSFKIPTSQDYGDLSSIQVIPDDQDSNSHIYDKLKIEYITVTKESDAALTPTWAARGDDKNGLGWVGIEYRDPGEAATKKGAEGRTLSEIATTYQITQTGYSAKLMFSITTGPYSQTTTYDEHLNPTTIIDPTFSGGVSMTYSYFNTDGRLRTAEGLDIIEAMNEYMGRPGTKVRTIQDGENTVTEEVDYYVSDPQYHFRAGHTDNFFVTVNDIWQILDMQLVIRSSVVTKWNISKVSVYLVNGTGKRFINANGEYSFYYAKGEEPKLIAIWNRAEDQILSKDVQTYRTIQENSIGEVNISFLENEIPLDKATMAWSSVVPREPQSKNDTLNLYLYPEIGGKAADPNDYTISAAVRFTDATNLVTMQSSAGELRRGIDVNGQTVFYAVGIGAQNMDSLSGVDVIANARKTVRVPIRYGILQRIRGGVLIETYYLTGLNNAAIGDGGTLHATNRTEAVNTQRVFLQLPVNMTEQQLKAESQDLAAAIYFVPTYPDYQELRSKYVYLSDMGYTSLKPGQLLELDFDAGEISEITAVNLVRLGSLEVPVEHAYVANQQSDGLVVRDYSIQQGTTPGSTPSSVPFNGKVSLLTVLLKTAEDDELISSGTDGPIRMTIGYYDEYGTMRTKVYDDIRPYIEAGNGFKPGETDRIRLLVPGMAEARYIDLEPWNEDGTIASWKLEQLTAVTGLDGRSIVRNVNQRVLEDDPVRVFLSDVVMVGTVNILTPQEDGEEPISEKQGTVSVGEKMGVILEPGQQLDIPVRVSGSDDGVKADIKIIDPELGTEVDVKLDAVSQYEREYLEKLYKEVSASYESPTVSEEERQAAETLMNLIDGLEENNGDLTISEDGKSVLFIPPCNYGEESVKYLLYVSSVENPESKFLVEVTVHREDNELTDAIDAWNALRTVSDVYVFDENGAEAQSESVANAGTLSLIIDSGSNVMIDPKLSEDREYTAEVVEISESGAETKADFNPTHGYSERELDEIYAQAMESFNSPDSVKEEKDAAQKLMNVINAMKNGSGLFDEVDGFICLMPPRNYTNQKLRYRIDFKAEETEEEAELTFSVDVTVRTETDTLQSAYETWKALRSAGKVDVLDESGKVHQTVAVSDGESTSVMIESGETIEVYPRLKTSDSFTATLASYDAATGATGRASLEPNHGYSEAQLKEMKDLANEILALQDATDGEKTAAQNVLDLIDEVTSSAGSFSADSKPVRFTAPRNYTDTNQYYKITVTESSGEELFNLIVSVKSEESSLIEAYNKLKTVHEAAEETNSVEVTIIDKDGKAGEINAMPKKTTLSVNLAPGESLSIHSRYYGQDGYNVTLRTYPVTSTAPSLKPAIPFSDSEIREMKEKAEACLNTAGATDLEKSLAQKVLDDIAEFSTRNGSFNGTGDPATFTPPRNYTDEAIGYQISVNQGNEWIAIIVITTEPEKLGSKLTEDYEALLTELNILGTFTLLDGDGNSTESGSLYADNTTENWKVMSHGTVILSFKDRFKNQLQVSVNRSLEAIHPGWNEESVENMRQYANDTLALSAATSEEIAAANKLLETIDYVMNSNGTIKMDGAAVTIRMPAFTGTSAESSSILIPFEVKQAGTQNVLLTANVSLNSEKDQLTEAWQTFEDLRYDTIGHLAVLDENGGVVRAIILKRYEANHEVQNLEILNGQKIKVFFRDDTITSSEAYVYELDPSAFSGVSAYDQATLDSYRSYANEVLAIAGVTEKEVAAANKVLADLAALERAASLSYDYDRKEVTYTGVLNYKGTLRFTITLGTTSMGALDGSMLQTLAIINCTQPAGEDPLKTDYPALVAARAAGDAEREPETTTAEETTTQETTTEEPTTEEPTTEEPTTPEETPAPETTTESETTQADTGSDETTEAQETVPETAP